MPYFVLIMKRAKRQLFRLPFDTQERIAEGIGLLGQNPQNPILDIKPLINDPQAQYRLRVGNYRIKFNRDDKIKVIAIIRIAHRKDVYK